MPQIVKIALRWMLAGLALAAAAPALAMPVSTFLAKMDKLISEGPMATATSDAALVKKELQDDAAALRSERVAATQDGKLRLTVPAKAPPSRRWRRSSPD